MMQRDVIRNMFRALTLSCIYVLGLAGCNDSVTTSTPPSSTAGPLAILTTSPLPDGTVGTAYSLFLAPSGGTPPYTWSLAAGSPTLPNGLSLNQSTGQITGTPTTLETKAPEFQLQDSKAQTVQKILSITINPAPTPLTIVTNSLPGGTINQPYATALAGNGGTTPYTWGLKTSSPPLPSGLTLGASTGAISGTPTVTSNVQLTFTLQDATSLTVEKSLTLTINAVPLSITTNSPLPQGTASQNYSTTLTATGGTGAYTWGLGGTSPPLPTGLTLNPSTGVISGIPTGTSNQTYTFTVTDQTPPTPQTVSKALQLVIGAAPPTLTITTNSPLPPGTVTQSYNFTLTASGGTGADTWDLFSGSLPAGLNLSPAGVISGTPTATGTSSPTFRVKDSGNPQQIATKQLSITINNPAPPNITTTSLPAGTFNVAYNQTLGVTGGIAPLTWGVISGGLPDGLSLNTSTGQISGTPTSTGTFGFTVQVSDAIPQSDTQVLSITINPPPPPSITGPSSLSTGTVNQPYPNTQLTATGGATPYTWSVSPALPNGLMLDPNTGIISGTPLSGSNGTYSPTFTVTDSTFPTHETGTMLYSLTINANVTPVTITTPSPLPNGTVCSAYSQLLAASGGTTPYTWSLNSGSQALPAGLSLDASSGAITGTPTTTGPTSPTFKVVDSTVPNQQSTTKQLSITIGPDATLQITTTSLPDGTTTTLYSQPVIATGGCSPLTWSILSGGSLPPGLTLDQTTGLISGTPTATGLYNFTVEVSDSLSAVSLPQALSINITS